jgi:hypothetical protein
MNPVSQVCWFGTMLSIVVGTNATAWGGMPRVICHMWHPVEVWTHYHHTDECSSW